MKIAQEFLDGASKASVKRDSLYIDLNGKYGPGLYSYGNHYPVLLDDVNGLLLNTAKSTVTTNKVVNAVKSTLAQNGYHEIDLAEFRTTVADMVFVLYKPQQG
jgi:hypothetical protein